MLVSCGGTLPAFEKRVKVRCGSGGTKSESEKHGFAPIAFSL
jgi:hypothetical protein